MLTKPCGYVKCQNVIASPHAWIIRRRKYCSLNCIAKARLEGGWVPHKALNHENRLRGSKQAAKVTNGRRQKQRMLAAVKALEAFITPDLREALSVMQLARVKVLLARAFLAGDKGGYSRGFTVVARNQERQRKAQGRAA